MSFIVGLGMSLGLVAITAGMLLALNVAASAIFALSVFLKNKLGSSLLYIVPFRKLVAVTFRAWLFCVLLFLVLQIVGRLTQVGWIMWLAAMFPLTQQIVCAAFFFILLRTSVSRVSEPDQHSKLPECLWAVVLALFPTGILAFAASIL